MTDAIHADLAVPATIAEAAAALRSGYLTSVALT